MNWMLILRSRWLELLGLLLLAFGIAGCSSNELAVADPPPSFACGPGMPERNLHKHFLAWTPDGENLVFSHGETIQVVDAAGTQLRTLVDISARFNDAIPLVPVYGFYAGISPDSQRIVYSSCNFTSGLEAGRKAAPEDYHYEIAVINLDGTGRTRLTENAHFDHFPVWSPDGTRIAFMAGKTPTIPHLNDVQLFTMLADGSDVQALAPELTRIALYPPVWSPDGESLAFLAYGLKGSLRRTLYTVKADGSELTTVRSPFLDSLSLPAWSPDGQWLAQAQFEGDNVALVTLKADGSERKLLITITSKDGFQRQLYGSWIHDVLWSPDGSQILYTCEVGACIVNVGDGRVTRLPRKQFDRNEPVIAAWSPDGSRVALYGVWTGFLVTLAPDGTDARGLVWLDKERVEYGEMVAWNAPRPHTAVDLGVCAAGLIVPSPRENPGLVQDCKTLLGLRDTLAGHAMLNWNGETPLAKWWGITLGGEPMRVHRLNLPEVGLTGALPPELGQLTMLQILVLGNSDGRVSSPSGPNGLTGTIPPEIGQLTRLIVLDLSGNFLSGEIPAELGNLVDLRMLELNQNYLTGSVPKELSGMTRLRVLDLGDNALSGNPPPELGALEELEELRLHGNGLSGCVPTELPDIWVEASGLERCA